jgi:hypothetical protein
MECAHCFLRHSSGTDAGREGNLEHGGDRRGGAHKNAGNVGRQGRNDEIGGWSLMIFCDRAMRAA